MYAIKVTTLNKKKGGGEGGYIKAAYQGAYL